VDEFVLRGFLAGQVHVVGPLNEFGAATRGKDVVRDELVVVAVHLEAHAADALHHVIVDEAVAWTRIEVKAVTVLIEGKWPVASAFSEADAIGNPVAGNCGKVVALRVARVKCRAVLGLKHIMMDAIIGEFVHAARVEDAPVWEIVEEVVTNMKTPTFHEDGR
jgi:hypothetical protein